MVRRKLRKRATGWVMMCNETGVVATGDRAKWRIKDTLAKCASYDGKLRFSTIKVIGRY